MSTPRRTVLKHLGAAALVSTGAAVVGASSASAAVIEDDIMLDSYTGTDDEKLTKALAAAQSSSPRRAIRLSGRAHTFTQTRTTFSGLRILGTLARRLAESGERYGLAAICIGVGQGLAVVIENVNATK